VTLREKVRAFERQVIVEELQKDGAWGRMARVAKALGIHRKTLNQKKEHQIDLQSEAHPQRPLPGLTTYRVNYDGPEPIKVKFEPYVVNG